MAIINNRTTHKTDSIPSAVFSSPERRYAQAEARRKTTGGKNTRTANYFIDTLQPTAGLVHQRKQIARKPMQSMPTTTRADSVVCVHVLATSSKAPECGASQVAITGTRLTLDMKSIWYLECTDRFVGKRKNTCGEMRRRKSGREEWEGREGAVDRRQSV